MRFFAEQGTSSLNIGGTQYAVGDDGSFDCDNPEHFDSLRVLGCRSENDPAPVAAPVVAAEPPAIPEGYVTEEAVRALVEENEDLKIAVDKLNGEAASAKQVEEELRNRIQELEAAAAPSDDASGASETGTGAAGATESGESTAAAAETAPADAETGTTTKKTTSK